MDDSMLVVFKSQNDEFVVMVTNRYYEEQDFAHKVKKRQKRKEEAIENNEPIVFS